MTSSAQKSTDLTRIALALRHAWAAAITPFDPCLWCGVQTADYYGDAVCIAGPSCERDYRFRDIVLADGTRLVRPAWYDAPWRDHVWAVGRNILTHGTDSFHGLVRWGGLDAALRMFSDRTCPTPDCGDTLEAVKGGCGMGCRSRASGYQCPSACGFCYWPGCSCIDGEADGVDVDPTDPARESDHPLDVLRRMPSIAGGVR